MALAYPHRMKPQQFQQIVLRWFDQHGRKDLPWQKSQAPYRVWISEIMLQQTQVTTVIPYFERFMQRFPNVKQLAQAKEDEVLHLWTGLGYYNRARNLLRTAKIIAKQYNNRWPTTVEELSSLPGIGRSTAGAIASMAMQLPTPILDGNVKRLFCRLHGVQGWPGQTKVHNQLWELVEHYMPIERCGNYSQALMDLGATICTRSQPKCQQCPLTKYCQAYKTKLQHLLPNRKPRKTLPVRATVMLMLHDKKGQVLLAKRPPVGIWASLWSFPECPIDEDIKVWCQQRYPCRVQRVTTWPSFRHTFSHFHLDITPVKIDTSHWRPTVSSDTDLIWYSGEQSTIGGLPAPVKALLTQLEVDYDA